MLLYVSARDSNQTSHSSLLSTDSPSLKLLQCNDAKPINLLRHLAAFVVVHSPLLHANNLQDS